MPPQILSTAVKGLGAYLASRGKKGTPEATTEFSSGGDQAATSPKDKFVASAASKAYKGPSIYDYTSLSGNTSPYASAGDRAFRGNLADEYGVQNYNDGPNTAAKNTELLNALRAGNPGAGGPAGGGPAGDTTPGAGDGIQEKSPADKAFESYLASLGPSQESIEAQDYLTRLKTAGNLSRERALGMGETLGFAGGEAQRVGRNIDIKTAGAAAIVEAQAALDANKATMSKARYEYEQKKIDDAREVEEAERDRNKPFELSPGQARYGYNQETGQYEETARLAPKPTAPSTRGTTYSGGLTYSQADAAADNEVLESSRDADGYVDGNTYNELYEAWVAKGGLLKDFLSKFPPDRYVDPNDSSLSSQLKPSSGGRSLD